MGPGGHLPPREERKRLAELGLLGLSLPEEYGGGGAERWTPWW